MGIRFSNGFNISTSGNGGGGLNPTATPTPNPSATPNPTATSAPSPTGTPTPTSTGAGIGAWYFYSDEGNINADPPTANGNTIFTINSGGLTETFNPNKSGGVTSLYFNVRDSVGTNYTSQFSGYTGGTGTITISQNGDTATYTSTTPMSFFIETNAGGSPFFIINANACTQTVTSANPFVYADPISITFGEGSTPTPTPTATEVPPTPTPSPTPTPTATEVPPTLYAAPFSTVYGDYFSACGGNANNIAYTTSNSYPQLGDIYYTNDTGTTTYGAGFYKNNYDAIIELDSSGVMIGGPDSC